jgi:type II secretory pathway pseudopilin PulG
MMVQARVSMVLREREVVGQAHPTTVAQRLGTTLIEVLATLVVIGIVLPVVMKGIALAVAAGSVAKSSVEAASLAEMKLQEVVMMSQTGQAQTGGDFGADWPGYQWKAESISRDMGLMEVSVEVRWMARGVERSVRLTTLVYDGTAGAANTTTP